MMNDTNTKTKESTTQVSERDDAARMTFTRVIGTRTTSGAFGGWGPRLSMPVNEVIKPN
jgi:hypothetical protein